MKPAVIIALERHFGITLQEMPPQNMSPSYVKIYWDILGNIDTSRGDIREASGYCANVRGEVTGLSLVGVGLSSWSVLSAFVHLETLCLFRNKLTQIDADVVQHFPRLKTLYLNENPIQNIPATIYNQYNSSLEDIRKFLGLKTNAVDLDALVAASEQVLRDAVEMNQRAQSIEWDTLPTINAPAKRQLLEWIDKAQIAEVFEQLRRLYIQTFASSMLEQEFI